MSKAKIAILKEAIRLVEAKEGTIESIVIGVNNVWLENNECYPLPYGEYKRRAWLMDDLVRMLAQLMDEAHAEALEMDDEFDDEFDGIIRDGLTPEQRAIHNRRAGIDIYGERFKAMLESDHAEALAMDAEISEATAAMNVVPNHNMTPAQCLRTFLAAWLAWAELDAPPHAVFDPVFGLCSNLDGWLNEHCQRMGNDVDDLTIAMMQDRLKHERYPFGCGWYSYDVDNRTHHRHAPRREWVRAQLADLA